MRRVVPSARACIVLAPLHYSAESGALTSPPIDVGIESVASAGDRRRSGTGEGLTDLATALLPMLHRSSEARFNVFDVMHHGTHEKQLSNVFRWLLETGGSHHLADTFLRIFIEEVNRGLVGREPFAAAEYLVMQEVNTSEAGEEGQDIADLVLENDDAVIVVENYFTSDGHGHSYERYLRYSQRDGRQGAVVLLCHDQDSSLQTMGWENASVVTYGRLLDRLWDAVEGDRGTSEASRALLIHRPDAPQVRQGEKPRGRPTGARLRRRDVRDK